MTCDPQSIMPVNASPISDRSLDELEGVEWGPPTSESGLVINIHRLRRLPPKQYRIEDLRLIRLPGKRSMVRM